jgi:hypothetical protein
MLESSTNGAGAGPEAAAAGREDQRGVAGLAFGAGGRAAPEGVPDPELVEQAKRRKFTAKYKAEILARADACTRPGEVGEQQRRPRGCSGDKGAVGAARGGASGAWPRCR